jgi:hypothetical protein
MGYVWTKLIIKSPAAGFGWPLYTIINQLSEMVWLCRRRLVNAGVFANFFRNK